MAFVDGFASCSDHYTLKHHHDNTTNSSDSSMVDSDKAMNLLNSYNNFVNSVTRIKKNVLRSKGRDFSTKQSNDKKMVRYVVLQPSSTGEFYETKTRKVITQVSAFDSSQTDNNQNKLNHNKKDSKIDSKLPSKIASKIDSKIDSNKTESMSDDEAIHSESSQITRFKTSNFNDGDGDHSVGNNSVGNNSVGNNSVGNNSVGNNSIENATGTSLGEMSSGECKPSAKTAQTETAFEIHMKKKRARMKTLSSSSSVQTDDKRLLKNRHFSKADTVKASGDQNGESDDDNTIKIDNRSKFSRRARKETENSGKHDFKTSDYNSKFSDSNAKDSEFSVNIKNTGSEKFQKNGGSVQNNMENKEWLLKNIPGSILLYRVVFLKCHIWGKIRSF